MKRSHLVVMALVIASGGGLLGMGLKYFRTPAAASVATPKTLVMYAITNVKAGEPLRVGENVDFRWMDADTFPSDALEKNNTIVKAMNQGMLVAAQSLVRNETVRRSSATAKAPKSNDVTQG